MAASARRFDAGDHTGCGRPVSAERSSASISRCTFSASRPLTLRLAPGFDRIEEIGEHGAMMLVRKGHRIGARAAAGRAVVQP